MIAIAGGRTVPAQFQAFCGAAEAEGCANPPEFPNLWTRWRELEASSPPFQNALARAGDSYRDARIRAVFALAPALGPAFAGESLRSITTPVAIVAGAEDRLAPIRSNARMFARVIPSARLTLLPGAGHYTFLAVCTEEGRRAQTQLCDDGPGVDRNAIHQRTTQDAADFFDQTLR